MRRSRILWSLGASAAVVIGGFGVSLTQDTSESEAYEQGGIAAAMAEVGKPKLDEIYAGWVEQHEARGGDHNVQFQLGRTDVRAHGLKENARYSGAAVLDVIEGSVFVQASGLPDGAYDVWLIDDRPGAGNSIQPDPSDLYVKAGALEREGDRWTLEAELGAGEFSDFQVDQLVVTAQGAHPTESTILRGGPDFFQRLYTSLRTPELLMVSDYAPAQKTPSGDSIFGVREAFAQRQSPAKPIQVDPDVVLDDLIRLGADVFINETFAGNGRTCETCHPFLNNITTDAAEIARRPDNDPIFLSENDPNFAGPPFDLDIPVVLRQTALIGIRDDGLDNPPINRAVPHLFAVSESFGPPAPVVLPFGSPMAPPTPFPLPDPNDPNDPARAFGLDVTLPIGAMELGGPGGPGAGFPAFGFTVDNGTNPPIDRLGFGGDLGFAPELGLFGRLGDAVPGAIVLLLAKTPERVPGRDFRFPTPQEVAAVTAFYLTLGRSGELDIASMRLSNPIADFGRQVFLNPGGFLANFPGGQVIPMTDPFGAPIAAGKCNVCHSNAGAKSDQMLFDTICAGLGQMVGLPFAPKCGLTNFNFETGVEALPAQPATIVAGAATVFGPPGPGQVFRDGGFGVAPHIPGTSPGDVAAGMAPCFTIHPDPRVELPSGGFGTVTGLDFPFTDPPVLGGQCTEEFNTPRLVEAADTPPFFHNNNSNTIESAVEFYNTNAFRNSSGGIILGAVTDGVNGIDLENTEVQAVSSFLRVINALENLRSAREFASTANGQTNGNTFDNLLDQAIAQAMDAAQVLEEAQLNTAQVDVIQGAVQNLMRAKGNPPAAQAQFRIIRIFGFPIRVRVDGGGGVQPNGDVNSAIQQIDAASAGLLAS